MSRMPEQGGGRDGARTSRWAASLVAMLTLVACGDSPIDPGGDGGSGGDAQPAQIDSYLSAQPSWASVSAPVAESQNIETGDPVAGSTPTLIDSSHPDYNPQFVCTTQSYSLAKNPDKIVTLSTDVGLLVPGMLLQGKSHIAGSLLELSVADRAPVDLVINQTGVGNPSRTVDVPSLGSLQTGVNSLIQEAETSQFAHASNVVFSQVTSHSQEQAALGLGLSVKYLTTSAKGQLNTSRSASTTTVTASFTQNAFSIRAVRPALPSGWFTEDFTQADMDAQIAAGQMGPDNLPLYVAEVTYGRVVVVNFTSTESESEIQGMFRAATNNGVGSVAAKLDAEQQQMVQNAEISIVQLGGPDGSSFKFAKEILDPGGVGTVGLDEFFAQDVSLTTFVPISYTLADLRTGQTAKVGELTEYEVLECEAITQTVASDFEADIDGWSAVGGTVSHETGANYTIDGSGSLKVVENTNGLTRLQAPAKYLGDKTANIGGEIRHWVRWWRDPSAANDGNDLNPLIYPHLRIIGANGRALVYSGPNWKAADFPRDTWDIRVAPLVPGFTGDVGWRVHDAPFTDWSVPNTAVPATQADFDAILADVVALEVQGEFRGARHDRGWIDQFELRPPTN